MTSTGQWWLHPFATGVYWRCTDIHLLMIFFMLSNEHRNKILRCPYPMNYGGFGWRHATSNGDILEIRGRTAALASPSRNAEEKVSLECTTRHPMRGKKWGIWKSSSHPFCKWKGWSDFLKEKYGRKVQTWVWILFFVYDPWLLVLKQFASSEGFITVRTLQREVSIFNR